MGRRLALARSGVASALLLACFVGACAKPHEPEGESRARQVLDAQYAAQSAPKPMQASEADRIYENYLENMGKPLESDRMSKSR